MSERNDLIESRIDRELAGALSIRPHTGGAVGFTIAPKTMAELLEFSKLMSVSGVCIRQPFRNNPGACLSVLLQAMRWGADPFAVANKAFVVNDQVSYEAQLINAIVNSSTMLAKRLDAAFEGQGPKRTCRIVGYIKGDNEPREYLSPEIGTIPVKNSPLWKGDPDQQLFYYSTRAWARRWLPEVLLGIYSVDELQPVVELTPAPERHPAGTALPKSQLEQFEERHSDAPLQEAEPPASASACPERRPGGELFDPNTGEVHEPGPPIGDRDRAGPSEPAPDPVWVAEFNALRPRPGDLSGESMDWETYVQALAYLIGKASRADIAAVELSKNPHLKRLRQEDPERYRDVTGAINERARAIAAGDRA